MAYRKKNYNQKTPEEKQKEIEELTTHMTERIDSYFESEEQIKEHLRFMSNFYNYSTRNMALIDKQFMGAEAVGSFNFWKEKGASVKKGEKGIKILVPAPVKYFNYANDAAGKPLWKQAKYANASEKAKIENGVYATKTATFFKVGHVFEYTQTNAREIGLEVSAIFGRYHRDGSMENDKEFIKAFEKLAENIGVKIVDNPPTELGTAKGAFYRNLNILALNPRNTMADNIPVMIHELAHAELHNRERNKERERELTTNEKEFQAEMTAYVVATHYGIEMEKFSLPYLAGWTKGATIEDKEQLLNEVRKTSSKFIDIIDDHFSKEMDKQKNQDLAFEKPMYLISYGYLSNADIEKVETKGQLLEKIRMENTLTDNETDYIRQQKESVLSVSDKLEQISDRNEFISVFNNNISNHYLYEQNDSRPKILIEFSEHMGLEKNQLWNFGEANDYMSHLAHKHVNEKQAVSEQNNGNFPDDLNMMMYYKTRYHVLVPNNDTVTLINPDRFDIGDGYYNSPYQQLISEKNIDRGIHNNLLTDIAIHNHERAYNDFSINTINKPSMLLHGYTNEFKDFNDLNKINYNELNTSEIKYTVVVPEGEKLTVYSNYFEKGEYKSPLHQIGNDKTLDNSFSNKLRQPEHKEYQTFNTRLATNAFELER